MFRYFTQRKELKQKAAYLFKQAVAQARQPVFYEYYAVPDTVDGRFELVALHNFMLIHRLHVARQDKLGQALFDIFFINMDQSLREMGVGDLGVPKHMKRMMQGFNGRRQAYETALKSNDNNLLKQALTRNVYGTVTPPDDKLLDELIRYIRASVLIEVTNNNEGTLFAVPINEELKHG